MAANHLTTDNLVASLSNVYREGVVGTTYWFYAYVTQGATIIADAPVASVLFNSLDNTFTKKVLSPALVFTMTPKGNAVAGLADGNIIVALDQGLNQRIMVDPNNVIVPEYYFPGVYNLSLPGGGGQPPSEMVIGVDVVFS